MQGMKRLLLQHSGRKATVDRYSTIRNFFRQQHVSAPFPASYTFGTHHYPAYSLRARVVIRQFSQNTPLRQGKPSNEGQDGAKGKEDPSPKDAGEGTNLENYPRFFRRLAQSIPHLQRPTRDDFLKAADGFWQRLRVRVRWLTIRSFRRYNADELSAFFTWFLMSQTLWLFVGT